MLSIRKWANSLPVGKNFTIPAADFLPVGNGLQGSTAKVTKRHDGQDADTTVVWPSPGQVDMPNPPLRPTSCEPSSIANPKRFSELCDSREIEPWY